MKINIFDPKTAWKSSRNRPKMTPRGDFSALKFVPRFLIDFLLRFASQNASLWAPFLLPKSFQKIIKKIRCFKSRPRPLQFRPKTTQDRPKRLQEAAKRPQEAAKRLPRCPMMPPRRFQEAPRASQEAQRVT